MIQEYEIVSQVASEPRRRWFGDDYWDLIVWSGESGEITGFQLCYDKGPKERAVTWKEGDVYRHERVEAARRTMSPILIADGLFDKDTIAERFVKDSRDIDRALADFVYQHVRNYVRD